jgi:predicted O-methyltransferase YrrM
MEEEVKTKTKVADLKPNPTKPPIPTVDEIQQFVISHGTEDFNTFGHMEGQFVGGILCQQVVDEIGPCIHYLLSNNVQINSYLEVGAAAGGTTFLFNHFFHPSTIIIVDNNSHPQCVHRGRILREIDTIEIIDDSQSENAVRRAKKYAPYDFVLLDAVHTYMETMMDIVHFAPMIAPGGYIFLHDSVWNGGEVERVVREMKTHADYKFINEWISPTNITNPCGIALFSKKGGVA